VRKWPCLSGSSSPSQWDLAATNLRRPRAGTVASLTKQLDTLEASAADLDKRLKELQVEHSQVCVRKGGGGVGGTANRTLRTQLVC
jgi:hypothetical protein